MEEVFLQITHGTYRALDRDDQEADDQGEIKMKLAVVCEGEPEVRV